MRCGRRGCECTTCPECGADYPCNCALHTRTDELLRRFRKENPEGVDEGTLLGKLIDLITDWRYR